MSETILIVEDEKKLASLLSDYLKQANYVTHCIFHGDEVVEWVKEFSPSLILLDIMLPGTDGLSLCKQIRSFSAVPIFMITARVDEIDRVLGLELGADDYICKPFSPREVVARVNGAFRRLQHDSKPTSIGFELNEYNQQASFQGKLLEFTSVEFLLLKHLLRDAGRIYSRSQLMNNIYNDNRIVSDRTIDSHIKKIRKRFSEVFPRYEFIHSVYGAGYRFDICEKL